MATFQSLEPVVVTGLLFTLSSFLWLEVVPVTLSAWHPGAHLAERWLGSSWKLQGSLAGHMALSQIPTSTWRVPQACRRKGLWFCHVFR
jgi:hypothetical protein